MKSILVLLLLLPIAGCSPDKRAVTERCVAKVTTGNPHSKTQTQEEYLDSLGPFIADCMKSSGYILYTGQPGCDDGSPTNSYCYTTKKTP